MSLRTVNLKSDRPSVEEARVRLKSVLAEARRSGVVALKIIHGYGSSGEGGAIKHALHRSLKRRQREGLIRCYIPGERWDAFDPETQQVLAACPAAARDADLNNGNEGVTIVLLGGITAGQGRKT